MDIPAYGEKNLARNLEENDKKFAVEPCRVREKEESLKNFWKRCFEIVKIWLLKKAHLRFSIDRKSVSIDWNKQKFIKNFKRIFDWSKNRLDQSKIWKTRILEKTTWFLKTLLKVLNIRNKMHEYEIKCFSKTQVLNPVFPNLRFSNNLP